MDGCEVSGENIEGVGEIREQWVGVHRSLPESELAAAAALWCET